MGSFFAPLLSFFGTVFSPITFLFHYIFFQPVFNVLMLVYAGVGNFAIAIVILTLAIRACMIPLTRRQLSSSRKMQELAPQLNELKAQYKDDPQGMLAAQQALYKEHGVSLYGGCLPLLVQLPFLYALYYAFDEVLLVQKVTLHGHQVNETIAHHIARINADIYPFLPKISHLPNPAFFWTSLATPDHLYILPVLAGILTFIQLRMALPVRPPRSRSASAGPDPTQTMATMQYIMPFFTVFIGLSFPAGLALYWCISTGFSAVQQYFISGWGSLFVGVPGMERYVPKPKEPTPVATTTTRGAGSTRSNGASGASKTVEAPARQKGFLERVMERAAAAQKAAEDRRQAALTPTQIAEAQQEAQPPEPLAKSAESANGANGAAREKRQRSGKSGVTLVKANVPSAANNSNGAANNGSNGAKKALLPEEAIKRDGVGLVATPDAPITATAKRAATSVNGSNGINSNNGSGAKGQAKGDRPKASQGQRGRTPSGSGKRR